MSKGTERNADATLQVPEGLTQESLDKALEASAFLDKLQAKWGHAVTNGARAAQDVKLGTRAYGEKLDKHGAVLAKDGLEVTGNSGKQLPWITVMQIGEMLGWAVTHPMEAAELVGKIRVTANAHAGSTDAKTGGVKWV
jgi:hypothetical protein